MVLEATEEQKVISPSLSARYWADVPEDFLMKNSGSSFYFLTEGR
jgi:hypothetical protein